MFLFDNKWYSRDDCYFTIVRANVPLSHLLFLSLTYFTVARNITALPRIFPTVYRVQQCLSGRSERNKDSSRYLEFRSGSLFIVSPRRDNRDGDQDTVNARRQTENGIYARNRGRKRTARVIRRIDRLVFAFPKRNLSSSSFSRRLPSSSSSWSLSERQSIPGEARRRWGRREREPRAATGARKREGGKTEGEGWQGGASYFAH